MGEAESSSARVALFEARRVRIARLYNRKAYGRNVRAELRDTVGDMDAISQHSRHSFLSLNGTLLRRVILTDRVEAHPLRLTIAYPFPIFLTKMTGSRLIR